MNVVTTDYQQRLRHMEDQLKKKEKEAEVRTPSPPPLTPRKRPSPTHVGGRRLPLHTKFFSTRG